MKKRAVTGMNQKRVSGIAAVGSLAMMTLLCAPLAVWAQDLKPGDAPTEAAAVKPVAVTRHVSAKGSETAPFATWETAATTIHAAVSQAGDGDTVLVADGIYDTGGQDVGGPFPHRVVIDKVITLKSVNGPEKTVIVGGGDPGDTGTRCIAAQKDGTVIEGFTIRGGIGSSWGKDAWDWFRVGGGIWCASTNVLIRNCVIEDCTAYASGGAVYRGTLTNCVIRNNRALDWGCGGAYKSVLKNCTVTGNEGKHGAAGIGCVFENCVIEKNVTTNGDPTMDSVLKDCTFSANVTRPAADPDEK